MKRGKTWETRDEKRLKKKERRERMTKRNINVEEVKDEDVDQGGGGG